METDILFTNEIKKRKDFTDLIEERFKVKSRQEVDSYDTPHWDSWYADAYKFDDFIERKYSFIVTEGECSIFYQKHITIKSMDDEKMNDVIDMIKGEVLFNQWQELINTGSEEVVIAFRKQYAKELDNHFLPQTTDFDKESGKWYHNHWKDESGQWYVISYQEAVRLGQVIDAE